MTLGELPRRAGPLTVAAVAADSGVAPSAVRFYERRGVISATRTEGNHRQFDETAACRIAVARAAQRVGLSVREIAELFSVLPAVPSPADWERVADVLVAEAQRRVASLEAQLDALASGARLCDLPREPQVPGDENSPGR